MKRARTQIRNRMAFIKAEGVAKTAHRMMFSLHESVSSMASKDALSLAMRHAHLMIKHLEVAEQREG